MGMSEVMVVVRVDDESEDKIVLGVVYEEESVMKYGEEGFSFCVV